MTKSHNENKFVSSSRIVVIGGGTGTYTVLLGLKKYAVDLSVIVTMMDSGGSNRVIRDEFGLLPTSDIRQCMVALSSEDSDQTLRKLFTYRYNAGTGIAGMTFGNLFMAALTDIYGNQEKAIEETCDLLGVKGSIIPVTYDNSHLVARYSNGKQVLGEHAIEEPNGELVNHKIVEVEVFPKASANPKAVKAIKDTDLIVIGPGDLYTSVLPNILIGGIANSLKKSKAKKVFVMNLMTRHGQTDGYTAQKHLEVLNKYLGGSVIDVCLVNKSDMFPKKILRRYEEEMAFPVKDDFNGLKKPVVIRGNFLAREIFEKPKSDKLTRSLLRHDSDKIARVLVDLLKL